MKEYSLHFYSETPCNIYINGEHIGLIDNEKHFFIDVIVFSNTLFVTSHPISDNNMVLMPVSFKLNLSNNNFENYDKNIKIVPFPNNQYDINLSFKTLPNNSNNLFNTKVGQFNVLALLDSTSTISIFNNDNNLFTTHQKQLNNVEVLELNKLLIVSADCHKNKFLLAFNTETKSVLICDTFCKIEKNNDTIKCLKNMNNTIKTGKVYNLDLKEIVVTTYNVFLEDFVFHNDQTLIPYYFLDAIKEQNYNFALSFLDNKLSNTTTQKLKQFFGMVTDIFYNSYNLKSDVSNFTIFAPHPRNFNFYLDNNKIVDIEENTI